MAESIKTWYRGDCETSRKRLDNKHAFNPRQAKSSTGIHRVSLAQRLQQACGSSEIAEIARKVNKPYQTVKNYIEGGRIPETEILIDISDSTGVSIHWLLTGVGPIRPEGQVDSDLPIQTEGGLTTGESSLSELDENQRIFIERLAIYNERSVEEELREIIYAGLDVMSRNLSISYRHMNSHQLEDVLDAYFSNIKDENNNHLDNGENKKRA